MRKILSLSVVAAAVSSLAVAGGNIAPIEEPVVAVEPVEAVNTDAGFYIGIAYGALSHERDRNTYREDAPSSIVDKTYSEVMLQAGYKFNPYIAVEGRYWFGLEDNLEGDYIDYIGANLDTSIDVWALYVKPMYPVTDALDVYALLGYGSAEYDITIDQPSLGSSLDITFDGFTWGVGASYAFNDNVSVFIDYTRMYDDTTDYYVVSRDRTLNFDDTIDIINVGVTYKF